MSRYCPKCLKAKRACICQWIELIHCDTQLIILQHTSEEKRPLGTARILSLSLGNASLFVGEDFSQHTELNALIDDKDYRTVVLYPGEGAMPAETLADDSESKPLRVILLDGTWKKAFKMWKLSTNLHSLPLVKLADDLIGDYRIRKAPSSNALSTVEAGFHLLETIEPDIDFTPLVNAFNEMIGFQIKNMPEGVFERNYRVQRYCAQKHRDNK
ncbi:DTW domain-containing protein [Vibrio sp. SCSIO 43140]|uniref:tRNA-uridine aminocarboxypropyltransferase n=1 Tax=Vibrio sp. SCSIO 43140 TaxID=2819100 RepID=UPI0020762566|nr:DTW domain-containing protein [Vibrio sp. SCSIO 43140]USD61189.1 DTW domain-containing protein [Vibrio sp. SCSIO 43140]